MMILVMTDRASQRYFKEFIGLIKSFADEKTLTQFLRAILTPKEQEEIPRRLQIVKMLNQGLPQRIIAKRLAVGVATVTRGSKEVQKGNFKKVF